LRRRRRPREHRPRHRARQAACACRDSHGHGHSRNNTRSNTVRTRGCNCARGPRATRAQAAHPPAPPAALPPSESPPARWRILSGTGAAPRQQRPRQRTPLAVAAWRGAATCVLSHACRRRRQRRLALFSTYNSVLLPRTVAAAAAEGSRTGPAARRAAPLLVAQLARQPRAARRARCCPHRPARGRSRQVAAATAASCSAEVFGSLTPSVRES
jgi:hypothetical protein